MTTNDQPSFEDAFTQLRATVETLEAGNLSLEDASKLFEKGMQLAKQCNELLSKAELQVARLQRGFGEQMAMLQSAEAGMFASAGDGDGDEDEDA